MNPVRAVDEELLRRLPLPLAQLCRRAHNAKTALERHLTAFYLWEAALKLLAATAIVEFARQPNPNPQLAQSLTHLVRPALGHWWEFVRKLVPFLAESGDAGFTAIRDLVLGRSRTDLPYAAGLDAVLREALEGPSGARATVRLTELFDRLVHYRNKEIGHGAVARRVGDFHDKTGDALLAGVSEILGRLDVLAGRRLLYVGEVRQAGGQWLVQRLELVGENARRIESLELPRSESTTLPDTERVYVELPGGSGPGGLLSLHPLVLYDADADEILFLNARRGKQEAEYLSYRSGRTLKRPDLGVEQRALLARALGQQVSEGQANQWAAESQAEEGPADEVPAAPRQLGEFELLSELGKGGMGIVYRAWQPSLGRQVALKSLLRSGDARAEQRFRREIKALGQVEHPNLVKIFTSGVEGDQWFYVMELIEGVPLSAVSDRIVARSTPVTALDLETWKGALSTACEQSRKAEKPVTRPAASGATGAPAAPGDSAAAERAGSAAATLDRTDVARPTGPTQRSYVRHTVELMRQVAQAAHALHEQGVIHRDIKPGNVMVTEEGTQAVLMDLGLAQLADDEEGRLTRTRQFVGTLRYASPQQVLAVGQLDRRADVYSLGATLWELLTLRPLFGATEQVPTPEVMEKIQREEPERLSRLNPAVGRDLEAIVHKCLEKSADGRYGSAAELARDLERYLAGEPVQARPVNRLERAWKWVKRRPALAAAYGFLALALALGGVGGTIFWLWQEAEAARTSAAEARDRLADEKQRTDEALVREQQARQGEAAAFQRLDQVSYLHRVELAYRDWLSGQAARGRAQLDGCPPLLRHWEWYYVRRLCHGGLRELLTFKGHREWVVAVAFSPDGRRVASTSFDGTLKVWDPRTGHEFCSARVFPRIYSLAFSPDGKQIAGGTSEMTVLIWDSATGQVAATLKGHKGIVYGVAYSPDGKRLASGSIDRTIKLWDPATGRERGTLRGHGEAVDRVVFSADGQRLASAGWDGQAIVWDTDTLEKQEAFEVRDGSKRCTGVALSPDGSRLAFGGGRLRVWGLDPVREVAAFHDHPDYVSRVVYNPAGTRLAGATVNHQARVWHALTGKQMLLIQGHTGDIRDLAFSPDGQTLATASEDRTARIWDVADSEESRLLDNAEFGATCGAFSPDGKRFAIGGQSLRVCDAVSGRVLCKMPGPQRDLRSLAFSPDGRFVAAADSWDTKVPVIDAATGQVVRTLRGHTGNVWGVAFSPDGNCLATASVDGTSRVWDATSGQELHVLRGHRKGLHKVAFSPDGRHLASASEDRTAKIWDIAREEALFTLEGHTDFVLDVAFSPDGKLLASASQDRTVKVWDAATGELRYTFTENTGGVRGVTFSPDGKRLASASGQGEVTLWDVSCGQQALQLRHTLAAGFGVVFSPDGQRLASVGGGVQMWEAPRK